MKIMAISFKMSHACTAVLSAPDPAAGHSSPTAPPETPGHSRASVVQSLVVSLLLSPSTHKALFVLSKRLFPLSCVSFGGSVMGLMVPFSKRAYSIARSAVPRASAPVAGHC